jgi:phage terminase large subunit GpA-like protein
MHINCDGKDCDMATCDTCGNSYDKAFTLTRNGESGTFDSFECAAHAMAPVCDHCQCRILGHGVESSGAIYCCAHCARESGDSQLADRA